MVRALVLVLSATLAFAGCTKSSQEEEEAPTEKQPKARKKKKPREVKDPAATAPVDDEEKPAKPPKIEKPADPDVPSREDGERAMAEARELLNNGDFRAAEPKLKAAAAGGAEGADKALLRVRSELAAEELVNKAKGKIAAKDFKGARIDLAQVPSGLVLSARATTLLAEMDQREEAANKEMMERAAQKFAAGGGDASTDAPPAR